MDLEEIGISCVCRLLRYLRKKKEEAGKGSNAEAIKRKQFHKVQPCAPKY